MNPRGQISAIDWNKLDHAYGSAADIPALLSKLAHLPAADDTKAEPYFSLWSALCHQGDVYTASYAAVPYILDVCAKQPNKAHWSVLQLIVCVELARLQGRGPEIPGELKAAYEDAVGRLPRTAIAMQQAQPNEYTTTIAASALAIHAELPEQAEAYLELSAELAPEFLDWVSTR